MYSERLRIYITLLRNVIYEHVCNKLINFEVILILFLFEMYYFYAFKIHLLCVYLSVFIYLLLTL